MIFVKYNNLIFQIVHNPKAALKSLALEMRSQFRSLIIIVLGRKNENIKTLVGKPEKKNTT
jgi:hypothetical protein